MLADLSLRLTSPDSTRTCQQRKTGVLVGTPAKTFGEFGKCAYEYEACTPFRFFFVIHGIMLRR